MIVTLKNTSRRLENPLVDTATPHSGPKLFRILKRLHPIKQDGSNSSLSKCSGHPAELIAQEGGGEDPENGRRPSLHEVVEVYFESNLRVNQIVGQRQSAVWN